MHNWTVLENPEVVDVIHSAAEGVAYNYSLDVDDVIQEGYLLVADTERPLWALAYEGGVWLGLLHYELGRDLVNKFETEVRRRSKATSLEQRNEYIEDCESGFGEKVQPPRPSGGLYDRQLVELLMPAVWDRAYCYGMQQENAPDPDMPRSASNKATGNTLAAHLADIRRAWQRTPLTHNERKALLLAYGFDMKQADIAPYVGVSQPRVSTLISNGVGRIRDWLNGTTEEYEDIDSD
jgi:hypothetical protein